VVYQFILCGPHTAPVTVGETACISFQVYLFFCLCYWNCVSSLALWHWKVCSPRMVTYGLRQQRKSEWASERARGNNAVKFQNSVIIT
jgi:hypothetical protein